jgi:hypothetical protein
MQVDRDRFLEEGYLVLRGVILPNLLDALRTSYEILVERQKLLWASERRPDDPPAGAWETHQQPRLHLHNTPELIDRETAAAAEFWTHENTHGVSSELMGVADASQTEMFLICNPVRDRGPAKWHRDLHPVFTAPLEGYIKDIEENGPSYTQWNIPLYDNDVLWVIPGSHLRFNTDEENRRLLVDPSAPLLGGVQTHLSAGDGVAYITPILHWGSNYSTRRRRTIHGDFQKSNWTCYGDLGFTQYLSLSARAAFERWAKRSAQMQDHTEAALRAALDGDGDAYRKQLEKLHPGVGESGKRLMTVLISKAARRIHLLKHPGLNDVPEDSRRRAMRPSPTILHWGPQFADRFSRPESETLWGRFQALDAMLQKDDEPFHPGFQSGPMGYISNEMPANFDLDDFITGW